MTRALLALAFGLAAGLPAGALAAAGEPAVEPEAASASASAPKPRMICRTMPQLGTRFAGKRECATAEEWARMQTEQREALQKQQVRGLRSE
jgi:hypothetical protein